MRGLSATALVVLPCLLGRVSAIYNPQREYAGDTFFNQFAYYGNVDNTTWGNVTYLDQADAASKQLTFINGAGNAVVAVDNTTTLVAGPPGQAVRLTSLDSYGMGSLIIIDAVHIPFGCSVWPAFWTYGIEEMWPNAGEIDIIEAINNMDNNQIALHSLQGCTKQDAPNEQTGSTLEADCSVAQGCIVAETKPNSFGPGFAQAGGGVYALQIDVSGIFSWFWSRPDVPASIASATSSTPVDTTTWGIPTAAYPSGASCNITAFFPPQTLVLLTTLCGVWAGVPSIYQNTCHTPTNDCFADNVLGNGSNYADAYWEIRYIRTYLAEGATAVQSNVTTPSTTAAVTSDSAASSTVTQTVTTTSSTAASTGTGSGSNTNANPASSGASFSIQASLLLLLTGASTFWLAFF
ncbi:glycoside hydrolase family 16 protein [Hypholoma sublateritium FD-334 SS-4]|uniref:Glycoside hydrolase family 16 protein n=1 Tax=Hypholoma sublateritium (strain FD-334 SS-4) TaxID=945553 RepID=A0A0D2M3J4_HYPSF|nr:glycoside hydrolase family 16 protein [Hypholoma sublateritium FD-334 SS-4]